MENQRARSLMENYSPNKNNKIENRMAMQNAENIADHDITIDIENFDQSKADGQENDDDMERDPDFNTLNYTKGKFTGGRDKHSKGAMKFDPKD